MPSSFLLLVFNIYLLFTSIDLTISINDNPILQLSIYPNFGFSTENIEIRCQINQPSIYDNIYLSVKTDNVKPSGILLMVDNTMNHCRRNEKKKFRVHICNSSLIIINIDHEILNDSFRTIDYACSQGEIYAFGSYGILKDQPARYYDPKYSNSSSSLTHTFFLILFVLLITRITIIEDVRWLLNEQKIS